MTRQNGTVDSVAGLVPYGHVCWAYDGRADFRTRAAEYLRDGIAAGQWIEYVGPGPHEELRAQLVGAGLADAVTSGHVAVNSVTEFYAFEPATRADTELVVDPESAVLARVEATEQAVAAGYTGFRAIVDATELVRTPRQRRAFAEFEYRIDRVMSGFPVTAMCGFDVHAIGAAGVVELACLHPVSNLAVPFRMAAEPGTDAAVHGTVDQRCTALFTATLAHAAASAEGDELVLDASGLGHVDQYALRALNRTGVEYGLTTVLLGAPPLLRRRVETMHLPWVRTDK